MLLQSKVHTSEPPRKGAQWLRNVQCSEKMSPADRSTVGRRRKTTRLGWSPIGPLPGDRPRFQFTCGLTKTDCDSRHRGGDLREEAAFVRWHQRSHLGGVTGRSLALAEAKWSGWRRKCTGGGWRLEHHCPISPRGQRARIHLRIDGLSKYRTVEYQVVSSDPEAPEWQVRMEGNLSEFLTLVDFNEARLGEVRPVFHIRR